MFLKQLQHIFSYSYISFNEILNMLNTAKHVK